MIERLFNDSQLCIQEYEKKFLLFKKSNICYPEDYVELEEVTSIGKFTVAEVHRGKKQIKAATAKKDEAAIYAIVIYKRLFENITDRSKVRGIMEYIDLGKVEEALACAIEDFDNSIYAIGHEEKSKISLIQTADQIDVKFDGEYIAQNATLRRGVVVFYNYCTKLQYIFKFCDDMQKRTEQDANRKEIIKLYILGAL